MKSPVDQYPDLFQLLASYLHQDWTLEYADAKTALADGIGSMTASVRAQTTKDLDRLLLAIHKSEELAERTVRELCRDYYPPGDGLTWLGFLTEVRRMLA